MMAWGHLLFTACALLVLLYVPGYGLFRSVGFCPSLATCCAPLATICLYATLPIVYYELGIPCNLLTLALPVLCIAGLAFCTTRPVRQPNNIIDFEPTARLIVRSQAIDFDAAMLICYAAVGLLVCLFVFVSALPSPEAFHGDYDNQTHLNLVKAFLDSHKWSSLHTSVYLASTPAQAPVANTVGGFYPAAWHDLVALVCTATGASVAMSTNALIICTSSVMLPWGIFAFLRVMLPGDRRAIALGAIAASACPSVPWAFVTQGPTYPDMLGRALMITFCAAAMLVVERVLLQRKTHIAHTLSLVALCLAAMCSLIALALAHPNSVFGCYIFFVAYGTHQVFHTTARPRKLVATAIFALTAVAFWVFCYSLPMLQGVLRFNYHHHDGVLTATKALLSLGFGNTRGLPLLTVALFCGIALFVRRKRLWPLFPLAFFAVCYVATRNDWETITYWLAGFWYRMPTRYVFNVYLFALPFIAAGLSWFTTVIQGLVEQHARRPKRNISLVANLVVAILLVLGYVPIQYDGSKISAFLETPYGSMRKIMHERYAPEIEHIYDHDEVSFVDDVVALLPDGSYVFNSPNDGSMWAYAINGLNVYYRNRSWKGQTEDANLIRLHLKDYATNADVREAVQRNGIDYVLLLDQGVSYEDGTWLMQYKKSQRKQWAGIDGITEQTPGFELVLSAGDDMRLYRIVSS